MAGRAQATKQDLTNLVTRVPRDLWRRLKEHSIVQGVPMMELIAQALREQLARGQKGTRRKTQRPRGRRNTGRQAAR